MIVDRSFQTNSFCQSYHALNNNQLHNNISLTDVLHLYLIANVFQMIEQRLLNFVAFYPTM